MTEIPDMPALSSRYRQTLLRDYTLNPEDYERMYRRQRGRCAVCLRQPPPNDHVLRPRRGLYVDHDHRAGLGPRRDRGPVRGLLCSRCNSVLGFVEDSPAVLIWLARYLVAHEANSEWSPSCLPLIHDISHEVVRQLFDVAWGPIDRLR